MDNSIGRLLGHLEKSLECKANYSLEDIENLEKSKTAKRKLNLSAYYKGMKRQKPTMVNFCLT